MKTIIYCVLLSLSVGSFIWNEYKTNAVYDGYTAEQRAEVAQLFAQNDEPDWDNIPRLSVEDLK